MRIELDIHGKEIRGNQAVSFEVYDRNKNIGTLVVGRGSVRWYTPKERKQCKGKTWIELQKWLLEHGRILQIAR